MRKKILTFVYDNLNIGGIQVYFFKAIELLQKQDYNILIYHEKKYPIDSAFSDIVAMPRIEMHSLKHFSRDLIHRLQNEDCNLAIFTFRMVDMVEAQKVRNKFKSARVDVFYYVPDFKGLDYYLEDMYADDEKEKVRLRLSRIFNVMNDNNQLRYFSPIHVTEVTQRYGITPKNDKLVYVPKIEQIPPFDEERCHRVFNNEKFNLLTISRFDFPHKGFIIGIIKAYGRLKKLYPQLCYTIVGYGKSGETRIKEEIALLDDVAQKDIYLPGRCTPDEMNNYYANANLNISLAGCFSQGVMHSTLSLPARHYTYEGEVYGFLPESKAMAMSDKPGLPAETFIEEVLNMDEETYVAKCKAGYNAYASPHENLSSFLDQNETNSFLSDSDIDFVIKTFARNIRVYKWKSRLATAKKEGYLHYAKRIITKMFR